VCIAKGAVISRAKSTWVSDTRLVPTGGPFSQGRGAKVSPFRWIRGGIGNSGATARVGGAFACPGPRKKKLAPTPFC